MRKVASFLVCLWPCISFSQEHVVSESTLPDRKVYSESVKNHLGQKGDVKGLEEIKINKLFFVEAEQGTYLISSDGRFVFDGTLKDVWHRKTIKTIDDVRQTHRTPLSNLGFKPEEQLATFSFGKSDGGRQGLIFVDPTSPITLQLLQHLNQSPDKYNFTVALAPLIGGNNALHRARQLLCAEDRAQAKLDLLNGTNHSFGELKPDCSEEPITLTIMLKDIFNIEKLPHIIREDGLSISGYPQKFDEWLSQP